MKKLFAWLSGNVIKEIGDVIDKLSTTEEEKLITKKQVQKIEFVHKFENLKWKKEKLFQNKTEI